METSCQQRGSILVEFSLIAVCLSLLITFVIDVSRMVFIVQILQESARVAARELSLIPLPPAIIFEEALNNPIGHHSKIHTHIGQQIRVVKSVGHVPVDLTGYSPIYQRIGQYDRVVGFGVVQIRGAYPTLTITKLNSATASLNATTEWDGEGEDLTVDELTQVFVTTF